MNSNIFYDLSEAMAEHEEMGGYLLKIGDRPDAFVVCDWSEAVNGWGRSVEHLESLAPTYSEA